jgi:tetratricopeptide (TPR) repeat protein
MRIRKFLLLLASLAAFPASARAQAAAQQYDHCYDRNGTPQQQVDGCIAVLRFGRLHLEDQAEVLQHMGGALIDARQYARAIEALDKALKIRSHGPIALNLRCWARATWGQQLDAALDDCNAAIRLASADWNNWDSRGFVYYRLAMFTAARADYEEAVRLNPQGASALFMRGILKQKTDDPAGGKADIAAAEAIDDKIAEQYAGYGVYPQSAEQAKSE